ncbi:hypothetical protein PR048_009781 [Dryococelus australis]|uniref:DUF4371 domain-containing protein n=1 Tax=Dryococelus australis TaxID=614101 RepID=A0ABQ9I2P7_9NEOP|nr:hypothetical protein PR048_009781 [Dryococelus australis]
MAAYSKKGISAGLYKMCIHLGIVGEGQIIIKKVIEENRKKKLIPIIKTVIFCRAQNIPLRGHRDYGDLQTEPETKYGEYFTIMADETTDISSTGEMAICIRYFDTTSYEIQEKFFKFSDVDLSGENIARTILQELDRLNLDISYCHGQAYDGGSNMTGKFKGVQARIAKVQPLAIYSHCTNYRLNLAISKACSVASIRDAVGLPHLKKGKHNLKKMCGTRWVEKHDAVLTFLDTLPCLPVILETISESSESRGSNAFSFLHAIQSSEFLVSVVVLAEVFGLALTLGRKLQAEYMDVLEAMKVVEATLASLREQRYKSTDTFKKIFKESEKLAMEMGIQINKPRTTNLQNN